MMTQYFVLFVSFRSCIPEHKERWPLLASNQHAGILHFTLINKGECGTRSQFFAAFGAQPQGRCAPQLLSTTFDSAGSCEQHGAMTLQSLLVLIEQFTSFMYREYRN